MKTTIKSFLRSKEFKYLLFFFIVWRLTLFVFVGFADRLSLQRNFLGGGLENYLKVPLFWTWANFDGEHYLSIAQRGYGQGEQAFFPFYPLLTKILALPFDSGLASFTLSGLIISNLSFLIALVGIYRLIRLDFPEKVTRATILLILLFPASFYFGSVYTESLFLALVAWSFYFARKKNWLPAAILAAISTATRFIGILLLPVLLIEMFGWNKLKDVIVRRPLRGSPLKVAWLLIVPLGLIFYMFYLKVSTGDPLAFIHTLSGFGEQRSTTPIILPQVFYRYFFKILPNLTYSYFPVVFTTFLELAVAMLFSILSIISFFKIRLSYAIYLTLGFLIPTLSGSFSSLPRYVIVLFPGFLLMAIYFLKLNRVLQIVLLSILFILLGLASAFFIRGYWVA